MHPMELGIKKYIFFGNFAFVLINFVVLTSSVRKLDSRYKIYC